MCPEIDFLSHIMLLQYINPSQVWELGAGRGSWCIGLDKFKSNILYNLVEDFSWHTSGLSTKFVDYAWPATPSDVTQFIKNNSPNLNYNLYSSDILNHKDKFTNLEFVRIDCDLKNPKETYDHILQNSSDNLIILIDDVRPNAALNRMFEVIEYIKSGDLKVIITANDTLGLAKQTFNTAKFFKYCQDLGYSKNIMHRDEYNIYGRPADYITFKGKI